MSKPQQGLQKRIPWGRIIVAIIVSLLFVVGATIGILTNLNSVFNILSIVVAFLGVLFAFLQWIIPFSSNDDTGPSSIHPLSQVPSIVIHVPTAQETQPLDASKSP